MKRCIGVIVISDLKSQISDCRFACIPNPGRLFGSQPLLQFAARFCRGWTTFAPNREEDFMRRVMTFCALMLFCGSVRAGQVENPQYKDWAKYKAGTSTTIATTSDAGGQTSKMETKTTLKEV